MTRLHGVALLCAAVMTTTACEADGGGANAPLETMEQKASYAIGRDIGRQMLPASNQLQMDQFMRGFREALAEQDAALPEEDLRASVQALSQAVQESQQAEREAEAEQNRQEGEAYLAENAQKENVETTESGVQFEVIEEGSGDSPGPSDDVTIHYEGTLVDGTVFDSSHERGEPTTFNLGGVIAGFSEGLQLMQEGGKYRLVIPGALAYGPSGRGEMIGPDETLIFEVEMIEVSRQDTAGAPGG